MLNKIIKTKEAEVASLRSRNFHCPYTVRERDLPTYPFLESLLKPKRSSALIAEVKKASPSKGIIRADFHPVEIARAYRDAGVDCLSVLTDIDYFHGDPGYIAQIKAEVDLPILRKDFIIDPLQIEESVQLGADAILLIAKALPINRLVELYHLAEEKGLDILIEVANRAEVEEIFSYLKPRIIGINNRDLRTFTTSTEVTKSLLPIIPEDVLVISESGISASETVQDLEAHGVGGFLIGEHFMRQVNITQAVENLYAHS